MMKIWPLLICLTVSTPVWATPYTVMPFDQLVYAKQGNSKPEYGINLKVMDTAIEQLKSHAGNYPPQFDNQADQKEAVQDVLKLNHVLTVINHGKEISTSLLLRQAEVNSIGHNLDIPEAAGLADQLFQQVLKQEPENINANYLFGTFLGNTGRARDALPYLHKAKAGHSHEARYSLGIAYLMLGDKEQALNELKAYRTGMSDTAEVDKLINAIETGQLKIKQE